jgi:type I restriction enzyme, S subunit
MTWPAYPQSTSIDIPWLDSIPSTWKVKKFRHCFRESAEKNGTNPVGEMLSVSGYRGVEIKQYDDDNRRRTVEELADYRVVRVGQLAVNTMWLNYAGLGVSSFEGHISPAYRSYWIEPGFDLRFINYLMRSSAYVDGYTALLTGIRPNSLQMGRNDLMGFPILCPPLKDQRSIADFLDREVAKIDALIVKQEQLIATLREDRTATITHAVTKGLDPNVEMQDSGAELLGAVPAHWRQTQLRHIVDRIEQGVSPQAHAELADEGWGVLKSGCVNGGVFSDVQHKKLPDDLEIDPAIIVKEGDLVVCRASGSPDLVGSTALVRQLRYQLILSDKTFRLRPGSLTSPDYLEWAMNSRMYREQVRGAISGAEGLANNLPMSALKTFRLAVPPGSEQNHIVADLKERCGKIDSLIAKATEVIETIREYRSALITDAVTGKIDVRGAA